MYVQGWMVRFSHRAKTRGEYAAIQVNRQVQNKGRGQLAAAAEEQQGNRETESCKSYLRRVPS